MKPRLHRPRELAQRLRRVARRRPTEVEEYLGANPEVWTALAEASPHDAADILESVSPDTAGELLSPLERSQSAPILEELRDELAAALLEELPVGEAASVLEEMAATEAVDILENMETETVEAVIDLMAEPAGSEVSRLFHYPSDTAGGLMTTDVAVLPIGLTAGEAIERIRIIRETVEDLTYVYVTDDFGLLRGVLSFRDLVFVRPSVGLDEAMEASPVAVHALADREEVSELMQRYRLMGLPVVDDLGHLQGMVTYDEVIDAVQAEASEDFAASVGAGAEETIYTAVLSSVRMRLPWLTLNLLLGPGGGLRHRASDRDHLRRAGAGRPYAGGGPPGRERGRAEPGGGDPLDGRRRPAPGAYLGGDETPGDRRAPQRGLPGAGRHGSHRGAPVDGGVLHQLRRRTGGAGGGSGGPGQSDHRHPGGNRHPHGSSPDGIRPGLGVQHFPDPDHRCGGVRRVPDGGGRASLNKPTQFVWTVRLTPTKI